ncbi:hypothetical protein [Spirosoma aerolatum]|uniref:hypothetical protein n=1 Tax=Spirosoma aerolatum TaxID=1211326 RepID=UPI0009AD8CEE|nr:hypothetical protein [Spirosoma aerolatum]
MYQKFAADIKAGREFSDRILNDLMYKTNKNEVRQKLEERLNKELSTKKVLYADERKIIQYRITKLRENLLKDHYITYSKIRYGYIEYVKSNKNSYYFDLKSVFEKTSVFDIDNTIEEIAYSIYNSNLIHVLKKTNQLLELENLYPLSRILSKLYKFTNSIYKAIKNNFYSILFSTISIFILIFYSIGKFDLDIKTESQQTISLALLGAVATFIGFGVVFIQLSFDNYKKYYGTYSKVLLFNAIGKEIIIIFILNIITSITCAIVNKKYTYHFSEGNIVNLQTTFFYFNVLLFLYFLFLLIHKIIYIFDYSLSNKDLHNTIKSVKLRSIKEFIETSNNREDTDLALKNFTDNPVEVITEVTLNYLSHGNQKTAIAIIKAIRKHFQFLIEISHSNNTNIPNVSEIVIVFYRVIYKIINYNSNDQDLTNECFENIREFNKLISAYNIDVVSLEAMLNLIESALNLSFKDPINNSIFTRLECFSYSLFWQMLYNTPPWYDVQTGSPSIYSQRALVYANTQNRLNVLWRFTNILYNFISSCFDLEKNISTNGLYHILEIYKRLLENNISYNFSHRSRYYYLERLSKENVDLYKLAFVRLDFSTFKFDSFRENTRHFSPINTLLLDHLIKYDKSQISHIILDNYLSWCNFVMCSPKSVDFTSELVDDSLNLLSSLLYYLKQNYLVYEPKGIKQSTRNVIESFNRIIDFYYIFDYSSDPTFNNILNEINNRFWNFKVFRLKEINVPYNSFMRKLDLIISKTSRTNTTT